jgi:hypothetical protein
VQAAASDAATSAAIILVFIGISPLLKTREIQIRDSMPSLCA